jgi:hypothetical protein
MNPGSIVFVHGTGVRLATFGNALDQARRNAARAGIDCDIVGCAWGDPLGVDFKGLSLPERPSDEELEAQGEDFARWAALFADPLWELDKLGIRDSSAVAAVPMPGEQPEWEQTWDRIGLYQPSTDMKLLLQRADIDLPLWQQAWTALRHSGVARTAFEHSAHELPEAAHALARAVVAWLHQDLTAHARPGPSRVLRDAMVLRLVTDWGMVTLGVSTFFLNTIKRLGTPWIERHRYSLSHAIAPAIGDILLYQTRGEEIRALIREKIEAAPGPVTLVAHSLGGIACVDLLALPDAPEVHRLVTVGSQAPLLYEIGALKSLEPKQPLPEGFPRWLNIYDRNDMLSYVGGRLFTSVKDFEVQSGQPFPDSHSAYFANEVVWAEIHAFMQVA